MPTNLYCSAMNIRSPQLQLSGITASCMAGWLLLTLGGCIAQYDSKY